MQITVWTALLLVWQIPTTATAASAAAETEPELSGLPARALSSTPRVIAEAFECDEYLEAVSEEERKAY